MLCSPESCSLASRKPRVMMKNAAQNTMVTTSITLESNDVVSVECDDSSCERRGWWQYSGTELSRKGALFMVRDIS